MPPAGRNVNQMLEQDLESHGLVLADDLSGALDVGGQFVACGTPVYVVLDRRSRLMRSAGLIVLSTDSRSNSTSAARRQVQQAIWSGARCGRRVFFKKIDSTCQGNLVAEIDACLQELDLATAVLCPANPGQNRVVANGILHMGPASLDLRKLVEQQGCPHPQILRAPLTSTQLKRCLEGGPSRIVLADAATSADLRQIALLQYGNHTATSRPSTLLVGSAGLAREIALLNPMESGAWQPAARSAADFHQVCNQLGEGTDPVDGLPILLFVGSRNRVTLEQLGVLQKAGPAKVVGCERQELNAALRAVEQGRDIIVKVPIHQLSPARWMSELKIFAGLLLKCPNGGIIMSGGDTARVMCRLWRPQGMHVLGEIVPGVSCARMLGGLGDKQLVCTKPGGFGQIDCLLRAVGLLKRLAASNVAR